MTALLWCLECLTPATIDNIIQAMDNFIDKIRNYIETNKMLEDCTDVIVGLSGGADSVCLLLVLKRIIESNYKDISIHAVHVNHGIREEAERDATFSRELCERNNIEFECVRCDIPEIAQKGKMTLEEAGRTERYRIFREYTQRFERAVIAVAHHSNDQAETVLMNLARGSAIKGLGGIRPVNNEIIRPLLCVTRSQIEKFLSEQEQSFVTDVTNSDNSYTRNAVRNVIIPAFEENVNSNAVRNIVNLSSWAREADELIGGIAEKELQKCRLQSNDATSVRLDGEYLKHLPHIVRTGIYYRCITELAGLAKDFTGNHVEAVDGLLNMQVGKTVDVGRGIAAEREYDSIIIKRLVEGNNICNSLTETISIEDLEKHDININLDMDIYDGNGGLIYAKALNLALKNEEYLIGKDINRCYAKYFDCDKIKGSSLTIRFKKTGDYMCIDSKGHSRKLKKEFIDRKIPQAEREHVLLVCDGNEVLVAWNVRRSQSAMIGSDSKKILEISVETEASYEERKY